MGSKLEFSIKSNSKSGIGFVFVSSLNPALN